MKRFNLIGFVLIGLISLTFFVNGYAANQVVAKSAFNSLKTAYPQIEILREDDQITRIYGQSFGSGVSAEATAETFRQNYSAMFGVEPADLKKASAFNEQLHSQPLMYNRETGQYKFSLVYYSQYKSGIPVFRSELRLLVRNEPNYPLVLAVCALKDLNDYQVDVSAASINPEQVQQTFLAGMPGLVNFNKPRLVIWAGDINKSANPALGVQFIADNGQPATEKKLFIVDPKTGKTLFEQNLIVDVNVTGQVNGLATPDFLAEQCGVETSTGLPYAQASIQGGNSAYADSNGNFVITNGGSSAVTVISQIKGPWFQAINQAGSNSQLSLSVTPPGPANFLHNSANSEYTRAEVNGYLHANIVRDFTLTYNPSYNVIDTQTNFPVYVNDNTGYCPGNAWYDGVSLTFCRAGSGYPNTAFSTIVHHEYGHHLVEMAGSGQGAYGEGMGDIMGLLITDNPSAAIGFYGDCIDPLRSADNTMQYPCSGAIHYCGQLLSGCVWSTRNELVATHPTDYIDILANLAINAMFLHTGESITPQITIDYLTLDDNDGNIYNGTPHYSEICAGFGAHNMTCPALQTGVFITHTPLGNTTSNSAYQVDAVITSTESTIDSTLIYWSNGGAFQTASMTNVGGSNYRGYIPGQSNCTNVNYRIYATDALHNRKSNPETGNHTFYVGSFDTLLANTVESGIGSWTHSAVTSGYADEWAIRSHRNHTTGGANAWKCGNSSSSGTYASSSDGGLVTPQIAIQPSSKLTFWMWGNIEQSSATSAWDGARLEISVNGGAYSAITPTAGYTHTTVGGYSHPWAVGTPCWSGSFAWTQVEFNLNSYANSNVRFRFRFGTDNSVNYEGWYIDDVLVTAPGCDSIFIGTVAGTVTDINGPVSGAIVNANDGAGHTGADTTASDGSYLFTTQVGTYGLSFHQIDHKDTTLSGVSIVANDTTTANMVMTRLPGIINGTVTNGSTPVAGVRVVVLSTPHEDTTGSNGAYGISGLIDGTYSVAFTHQDYYDTTVTGVLVTPGDATALNLVMRKRPGWLSGIITDTSNAPLESVYVQIDAGSTLLAGQNVKIKVKDTNQSDDGKESPLLLSVDSLYTGSNGSYIASIASSNYHIRFSKSGYKDTTVNNVVVNPNDTTIVSPKLKPINHPPVITSSATATATEDVAFRYVATATDSDGTIPTIALSNYPAWLHVTADTIWGTPLEGVTSASFRIIASDGELADTQLVSVTITPVNDPPVITSASTAIATEHILMKYTATASDPEGLPVTFSFQHYPAWLHVTADTIWGTPSEGTTDTSFRIIASDGVLADTQLVAVTVIPVNDPPIITSPDTITVTHHVLMRYVATAVDPEGLQVTISFQLYPAWMHITGDTIWGTPEGGTVNTTFRIIASDGILADTQMVAVTVIPVNDPPVITSPATITATEHILMSYTATAVDPEGTTPIINYQHYPAWLHVTGAVISGTVAEFAADTSFMVIASDGSLADTQIVAVSVILINDPPVITSASIDTTIAREVYTYIASATDPENNALTFSFIGYPGWLNTINGNIVSGTAPMGTPDTSFMVIVSDGSLADSQLVQLIVVSPCPYILGDINGDGAVMASDVTYGVRYFKGLGNPPPDSCLIDSLGVYLYMAGDVNGSCEFRGSDITRLVAYFKGISSMEHCYLFPPIYVKSRNAEAAIDRKQ